MHQLHAIQYLPISKAAAWDFLSEPGNLKVITPQHMGFHILSGADRTIFEGQIIQYRVSPFTGYSTRWVTEITHVHHGDYFVDEQRFGPYDLWHHKHFLESVEDGVRMTDVIDFKLPGGFLGRIAYRLLIRKQLYRIFNYRTKRLQELFGSFDGASPSLSITTL